MASPFVSDQARKNRQEISALMSEWEFVVYPWEFRHYSQGDVFESVLVQNGEIPRYGAIAFDPVSK